MRVEDEGRGRERRGRRSRRRGLREGGIDDVEARELEEGGRRVKGRGAAEARGFGVGLARGSAAALVDGGGVRAGKGSRDFVARDQLPAEALDAGLEGDLDGGVVADLGELAPGVALARV